MLSQLNTSLKIFQLYSCAIDREITCRFRWFKSFFAESVIAESVRTNGSIEKLTLSARSWYQGWNREFLLNVSTNFSYIFASTAIHLVKRPFAEFNLARNVLSNKCSGWADQSIYLIFFNNYCHQAPVTIGLGLKDVSLGLWKLNNVQK